MSESDAAPIAPERGPHVAGVVSRSFRIACCRFTSGSVQPRHTHDQPLFGVVVGGEIDTRRSGRTTTIPAGCAFTEAPGESHDNRFRGDESGASVVGFKLRADAWRSMSGSERETIDAFRTMEHAWLAGLARRAVAEIAKPDDVTPLVLEGIALEILGGLARVHRVEENDEPPAWFDVALAYIREESRDSIGLSDVAREADVHPATLARAFRDQLGLTVGEYVRHLRLNRAMEGLADTRRPIAAIAVDCGFYDQSHLTRVLKRHTGLTPRRYRDLHNGS